MIPLPYQIRTGQTSHRGCKGFVLPEYSQAIWDTVYKCSDCGNTWHSKTLDAFTEAQRDERFVLNASPAEVESLVLVWVPNPVTKKRHSQLVPRSKADAEGLERLMFD